MSEELHIASLVVHSTPKRLQHVGEVVTALSGALIHATSPAGKLVVTLEAPTSDGIAQFVSQIQRTDGVLSVALVYQCADSIAAMNEEISDA